MTERLKNYAIFYLVIGVFVFIVELLIYEKVNYFSYLNFVITIMPCFYTLYVEHLWKFNPFDKTPRLYGKYKAVFYSDYDDEPRERTMDITIKQSLFDTRVYIETEEGESESIASVLVKKPDSWELVYTYINRPNHMERKHSEVHFGTAILRISEAKIINGHYYTDRKTSGDINKIEKISD